MEVLGEEDVQLLREHPGRRVVRDEPFPAAGGVPHFLRQLAARARLGSFPLLDGSRGDLEELVAYRGAELADQQQPPVAGEGDHGRGASMFDDLVDDPVPVGELDLIEPKRDVPPGVDPAAGDRPPHQAATAASWLTP